MNFYKHHLGDYAAATSHLTWDEDCAYRRLLDQYYKREAAIPADPKDACRWIRATSARQRKAVESVLHEFFTLEADGWHQKRCDEEIVQANAQAETNKRIADDREARRKARFVNDSSTGQQGRNTGERARVVHEPSTPTHGGREPSQTPDSTSQTPDTRHQTPSGGTTSPRTPRLSTPPVGSAAAGKPEAPTTATWAAYSEAYAARYGQAPVRNATVNGLLANVVARLGGAEAPLVAAFYVGHQHRLYVSAGHALNLLVRDAEKLRTEWATGRQVTGTQAAQADKTQTNFNAFAPMLAEAQQQETDHAKH
ncbi:MAG: DUF1376 domain-containing protein [Ramlibacter sp.]|nr:DUF1376 domain-containing protein [Ramlibacter sp.]